MEVLWELGRQILIKLLANVTIGMLRDLVAKGLYPIERRLAELEIDVPRDRSVRVFCAGAFVSECGVGLVVRSNSPLVLRAPLVDVEVWMGQPFAAVCAAQNVEIKSRATGMLSIKFYLNEFQVARAKEKGRQTLLMFRGTAYFSTPLGPLAKFFQVENCAAEINVGP